jgi:prepilin-type N-terminal cleavage/methylation domain-containing protein
MFNLIYKNKGFTLLEIILAIAVVSIIGVAFFGFFANSARIIKSTDVREKALILAQQEMEITKTKTFDDIISEGPKNIDPDENGLPIYSLEKDISSINSNLKKVIITVEWNGKSLDLESYIANRGEE